MSAPLSRNTLFLLSALLVLALGLRLYRVGTYAIYFDEKSTLLVSQSVCLEGFNQRDVFDKKYFTPAEFWKPKTIEDFIQADIRGDIGNSPSYYAVLWLWLKVFGLSDTSLRMPSVIFSVLIVWMLFVFVRRHFRSGSRSALSSTLTDSSRRRPGPDKCCYCYHRANFCGLQPHCAQLFYDDLSDVIGHAFIPVDSGAGSFAIILSGINVSRLSFTTTSLRRVRGRFCGSGLISLPGHYGLYVSWTVCPALPT